MTAHSQGAAPGVDGVPPADPSQGPSQGGPSSHQGGPFAAADTPAQALTPSAAPAPAIAATPAPATTDVAAQALTPPAAATPSIADAPTQAPSLTTPAAHTSPASQVAPALLSLATSTAGTQRLTLRLEPAELGTVQVRIDRPAEAPARVQISVSRPETLTLMLRDQAQLQHTLDQAGVPAEGRTVSFQFTGQDADSLSRQAGGFGHSAANGQTPRNGATAGDAAKPDDDVKLPSPSPLRWQRVGLDITA